jgi:hypothetical protein
MKTRRVTEKFDDQGRLVERIMEEEETFELAPIQPFNPLPFYPPIPQPIIITQPQPSFPPWTITCGYNLGGATGGIQ